MNVELNPKVSAIEWSAAELVRLRQRLEFSIKRCWEVNQQDEWFMRDWAESREAGTPTTELMTQFFESAHIHSVESGDLGLVYDVEGAYLAWLAFKELAAEMNRATTE
ncbi:MAG TPA: hypothetical protein VNH53_00765 [Sphingomicrobium sp.]|jgi:hypothetical protein|nr:hypothetical protein [Sphingomicrobium sp.]